MLVTTYFFLGETAEGTSVLGFTELKPRGMNQLSGLTSVYEELLDFIH